MKMLRRFIHPECAADLKIKTDCDHSYCKRKETFAKRPLLPLATAGCQAQILTRRRRINPQNTQCMDACPDFIGVVKIFAFLELERN